MPNVLTELYRHSFPKGLRFCNQCKHLHSNLTVVINRNKNKRFINRHEIDAVLANYQEAPHAWMRNPVLRRVLGLGFINTLRSGIAKKPLWILSNALHKDHAKLKAWLALYEANGGNMSVNESMREKQTASGSGIRALSSSPSTSASASSSSPSSSSTTSTASPTPAAGAKKGKWSASKYRRDGAAAPSSSASSASSSSVPTQSDKGQASSNESLLGGKTTRGIAADLSPNRQQQQQQSATASTSSAPNTPQPPAAKKGLYEQSLLAMRYVFGNNNNKSTDADPTKGEAGKSSGPPRAQSNNSNTRNSGDSYSNSNSTANNNSNAFNRNARDYIDREVFEKSFMANFHVAMYYHLSFVGGALILLVCLLQLISIFYAHTFYYWSLRRAGKGSTIEAIVKEHLGTEQDAHLSVEVPADYQHLLPPPAVIMPASEAPKGGVRLRPGDDGYIPPPPETTKEGNATDSAQEQTNKKRVIIDPRTGKPLPSLDGNNRPSKAVEAGRDDQSDVYVLNAVELTSPNGRIKVVMIPAPVVGPERFYKEVGALLRKSDIVLLEGVSLTDSHRQSANTFFPLHESFFEAYGLSHRFYDILSADSEPPMLLPAANPATWRRWLQLAVVPFPYMMIHSPMLMLGSKGEARIGWTWLLDAIDHVADIGATPGPDVPGNSSAVKGFEKNDIATKDGTTANNGPDHNPLGILAPSGHVGLSLKSGQAVIAVPWTVNQIANLEASLLKRGFTVTDVLPMRWMEVGQMGRAFASYFGVADGDCGPVRTAAAAE